MERKRCPVILKFKCTGLISRPDGIALAESVFCRPESKWMDLLQKDLRPILRGLEECWPAACPFPFLH